MKTAYEILGVHRHDDDAAVKAAYRALARQHHPDRNGGVESPDFHAVTVAYSTLKGPLSREQYDAFLAFNMDSCPTCEGEGAKFKSISFTEREATTCQTCKGSGYVPR